MRSFDCCKENGPPYQFVGCLFRGQYGIIGQRYGEETMVLLLSDFRPFGSFDLRQLLFFAGVTAAVFALFVAVGTAALFRFVLTADEDFFIRLREKKSEPVHAGLLFFVRNAVGAVLLAAGVLMLFLPGQGILTILLSLFFLEFPGRRRVIFRILDSRRTQAGLNGIRKKFGKKQFNFRKSL